VPVDVVDVTALAAAHEADGHEALLGVLLRLLRVDVVAAVLRPVPAYQSAPTMPTPPPATVPWVSNQALEPRTA
jgi:hypothetical protein